VAGKEKERRSMSWFTATYEIEAPADAIEARAQALAIEQSVECPLEAIGSRFVLDEIVARVAAIAPLGPNRYRVDISLSVATTGGEPAQFMNMIFGNASIWSDVRLTGLDLPQEITSHFPGPQHGIDGVRALLGAGERALTSTALKPQGLSVPELAKLCSTLALGGVDIIKDDHGIANQPYSPFDERLHACQRAVHEATQTTGHPSFYAPNLSGTPSVLRQRAQLARDAGVRVVLVAPMLVGIPAFVELVRDFPEFIYLAHPSAAGGGIDPVVMFGQLFRLFGADAIIFTNYGGRFAYAPETCAALASAARRPWDLLRPALPVPAGGMRIERVDEMLDFYGKDTMLLIGGDLLTARDALLERTRAYVAKVAAYGSAGIGVHA
jgi:ribulose-bisphosphate carboxylase large chain